MSELTIVDEWIFTKASTSIVLPGLIGSPLRVYTSDQVPQQATYPCVMAQHVLSRDLVSVNQTRILTFSDYWIKAIGQTGSYKDLKAIADEIDVLFQRTRGQTVDGRVYSSFRQYPVRLTAADKGVQYRHLGGLYRFIVQET